MRRVRRAEVPRRATYGETRVIDGTSKGKSLQFTGSGLELDHLKNLIYMDLYIYNIIYIIIYIYIYIILYI